MGSRRKAREFALQMLYQIDLRGCGLVEVLDTFWSGIMSQPDERAFAEQLAQGVLKHLPDLDARIEQHSINWKVGRMSLVDRNILRMGVYELLFRNDIPVSVTLNEAIELGKNFSSLEAGSFINGILDKVARGVPAGSKLDSQVLPHDDDEFLDDDDDEP